MLITIARRATWMNASKHRANIKQTSSRRQAISTCILNIFC